MEIAYLLLADSCEVTNGKLYMLGGGWNVLRLPLPISWRFGIGMGIDIGWMETDQTHQLSIRVEDPDGDPLVDSMQLSFEGRKPSNGVPGQDLRLAVAVQVQVELTQAGPHAVIISAEGKDLARSRFYVVPRDD